MDFVDSRALKSKLRREPSVKSAQQLFIDDLRSLNGVTGDDFSVDDLLDFSDKQFDSLLSDEEGGEKESNSVSSQDHVDDDINSGGCGGFDSLPSVPVDELKDLEWVSRFVDDSGSDHKEFSLFCPVKEKAVVNRTSPPFPAWIPVKARTKRTTRRCSPMGTWSGYTSFCVGKFKKLNGAVSPADTSSSSSAAAAQRSCSHCQVQKTPQWRTGPLGAKTLCNACGVRFKSGRLFPEYRPACSPTFSVDVHSNSHRKVLELRRRKEGLFVGGHGIRFDPIYYEPFPVGI